MSNRRGYDLSKTSGRRPSHNAPPPPPTGLPSFEMGSPMTTRQLMGNPYGSQRGDRQPYGNTNQSSYSSMCSPPSPSRYRRDSYPNSSRRAPHSPRHYNYDSRRPPPPHLNWSPPPPPMHLNLPKPPLRQQESLDEIEKAPALDEFEKAEMAKVIANNLSGSKLHQAILQKLREKGAKGITFNRIAWAFPELSQEVDRYCEMYHIPSCISALDVLKEMDEVQFQYPDAGEPIRFSAAEVETDQGQEQDEKAEAQANSSKKDMDSNRGDTTEAMIEGATATNQSTTQRGIDNSSNADNGRLASSATIRKPPSSIRQITVERNDMDVSDEEPSIPLKNYPPAAPITERFVSDDQSHTTTTYKDAKPAAKVRNDDEPKDQDPLDEEDDELDKLLRKILKRKLGKACLQFLLLLRRDLKHCEENDWPKRRHQLATYVLLLWGRKATLPPELQKWLAGQLEGYPKTHQKDCANFIAGKVMANYAICKCLSRIPPPDGSSGNTGHLIQWDHDRINALSDLFVQKEGPQIKDEEEPAATVLAIKAEEQKEEDQGLVQKQDLVKEEAMDHDDNWPEDPDLPSIAGIDEVVKEEVMDQDDKKPEFLNQPSIAGIDHVPKQEGAEIDKDPKQTEAEIARLMESVREEAGGVASMDFLVMLTKNYEGRTWPTTTKQLKMCVGGLVQTIEDKCDEQQLSKLPMSLRKFVGEQLEKASTDNAATNRAMKAFLVQFQNTRCVMIEKDKEKKRKIGRNYLLWNTKRVHAIRDYLLSHPFEDRNQPESDPMERRDNDDGKAINPPPSGDDVIEIKDSDDEEEHGSEKVGQCRNLSSAIDTTSDKQEGPKSPQRMASSLAEDANSLVAGTSLEPAALDLLVVLNADHRERHWPSKAKALRNHLQLKWSKNWLNWIFFKESTTNKKKKTVLTPPPKHLLQLYDKCTNGGRKNGAKVVEGMIEKIQEELVRLGCCRSKGKKGVYKWNYERVAELLPEPANFSLSEPEGMKGTKASSDTSSRKIQQESYYGPQSEHPNEAPGPSLAKRQKEPLSQGVETEGDSCDPRPSKKLKTDKTVHQSAPVQLSQSSTLESDNAMQVSSSVGSGTILGFDISKGFSIVSVEQVTVQKLGGVLVPAPPVVSNDIQVLLDLLPTDLAALLQTASVQTQMSEIVLDKGRQMVAWVGGRCIKVGCADRLISEKDIAEVVSKLGGFGSDDRAGLDEQLHRVAAVRNKQQEIVGLTLQVRRYVSGAATMIADILYQDPTKSILFLGGPGSGKTTLLRDAACHLAEQSKVVIVDTTSEIGGDGDIPHPSIGLARRIMVPSIKEQANVIAQCAQNHSPEVLVIDKIGLPKEMEAVKNCKDQDIRVVASAQGSFRRLAQSPRLQGLVGGSEPSGLPIFDIVVELKGPHEWHIIHNTAAALECIRKGQKYDVQCRIRDPDSGNFHLKSEKA